MAKKIHQPHKFLQEEDLKPLHNLAYKTVLELETQLGINASGNQDRYSAFFGRDSMITCLKLLRVYKKKPDKIYPRIITKTIKTAANLQGKTINLRSGEKPGKIIHEYREKGYYHLIDGPNPWYIYPDKTLRNYDSVDATPLFLILVAEFYNFTKDGHLLKEVLPSVKAAFDYLYKFSPKGGNRLFLEYQLHRPKYYGGLVNQGWMDSVDSILIYGKPPKEPIALVEVQGYYFKALKLWSDIFQKIDADRAKICKRRALKLKEEFNNLFLMRNENHFYFSYAIFANMAQILEVRSNPGHCLWATVQKEGKGLESIIDNQYIPGMVKRLMRPDLFDPKAGIRTLSRESKFFDPCSYHNGSVWPFDNGLIVEGLENFGYYKEADKIKRAVLDSISKLGTMAELYCTFGGEIKEYKEHGGHYGAHKQAWTAATILDFTT